MHTKIGDCSEIELKEMEAHSRGDCHSGAMRSIEPGMTERCGRSAQLAQIRSCNSTRSFALSCQPSRQMWLLRSLARCSSISAISRRFSAASGLA
ncbi:hypothetical protein WN72_46405 [Bradyrhizobium arachidis]|uniref:Uncharacterized protein n=1 Tax=Bradyrhizobium arachidis TaxID=858423 RepID=A0AAE7P0B5_9BRAD|nr:hypothetical protein WN72_46405 [Bradyrhizobium arachidis]